MTVLVLLKQDAEPTQHWELVLYFQTLLLFLQLLLGLFLNGFDEVYLSQQSEAMEPQRSTWLRFGEVRWLSAKPCWPFVSFVRVAGCSSESLGRLCFGGLCWIMFLRLDAPLKYGGFKQERNRTKTSRQSSKIVNENVNVGLQMFKGTRLSLSGETFPKINGAKLLWVEARNH